MKRILHSLIDYADGTSQENLRSNYFQFVESGIEFLREQDEDIYRYVQDFFGESRESELPSNQSVIDYFEAEGRPDVSERLAEIREGSGYIRSNFRRLCKTLYAEQKQRKLDSLLRETAVIKSSGMRFEKRGPLKKGVRDAVEHFIAGADELLTVESNGKLKGNIVEDGDEVLQEYELQKTNPKIGRLMGLSNIDHITKGLRPGELMLMLGFVGELKTTLALNYAYNTAIHYGWNCMYFSLEMKYEQVRRILYCIHSTHDKFRTRSGNARYIDYGRLRDGELTGEEEALLRDVAADFEDRMSQDYGRIIVERPAGEITVPEMKLKAEVEHRKAELGLIIADHAGLIENSTGRSVNNFAMAMNYVMKDLSLLALNFNDGEGIPVCTPFQANRNGWKEACKNQGHYKLDALSWANEAERSASLITYTFLGDTTELRDNNEVKIGCLKNRDGNHFKPFTASVHFQSRRIRNPVDSEDDDGNILDELGIGDSLVNE